MEKIRIIALFFSMICVVNIGHAIPHDVNGDTEINISDVISTINMVLGATTATAEADCNTPIGVDINDVICIINVVLSNVTPEPTNECVHSGVGSDYPVGPGQTYTQISEVPWTSLSPGDTVRIFWRDTPYKEKIIVGVSGTEQAPIRVCGVAGPDGEKPVLDGDGASNDIDDQAMYGETTEYHDMESRAMFTVYRKLDYNVKSSNIIFEGFHVKNIKSTFNFTRMTGGQGQYARGAACVRVQAGDNVVIRNNEFENCANGIFTMSQPYGEAHLTRNILIEGNYVHDSGQVASYLEHGMYVQAIGATIQNNRFGPNAIGTLGTSLKTRSAGLVIRYNFFEGGSARPMDLVEVEDARNWYIEQAYRDSVDVIDPEILAKVQAAEVAYKTTYVYGNLIRHVGSESSARSIIHFGADHDVPYPLDRTLYFYNNTVSVLNNRGDGWTFRLFYLGDRNFLDSEDNHMTAEIHNNMFHYASEADGGTASNLCMGEGNGGTLNFGVNWMTDSWNESATLSACYTQYKPNAPTMTGIENLIDINGLPVPIDLSTLQPIIPQVNQAGVLPTVLSVYPVAEQYEANTQRIIRSSANTLGAIEQQ